MVDLAKFFLTLLKMNLAASAPPVGACAARMLGFWTDYQGRRLEGTLNYWKNWAKALRIPPYAAWTECS